MFIAALLTIFKNQQQLSSPSIDKHVGTPKQWNVIQL